MGVPGRRRRDHRFGRGGGAEEEGGRPVNETVSVMYKPMEKLVVPFGKRGVFVLDFIAFLL